MELKTDKIHRILNTPYDELSPQDFAVAQEQLDVLVVGTRDKQIDAFQFIENKLVCERDEALKRVSQLTDQLAAQQEKPIALELMARIADLKRVAQTDAEAIANLIKERDRLIFERDAIKAELEQSKTQAANAAAMVVAITAERDAVQARETKLLWLIAGATERAERAEQQAKDERERRARYREIDDRAVAMLREQHAKDLEEARKAGAFAKLAAEETAAALEAMNKREAEVDAHGYSRVPGTPPAEVTGLYDHQCQMPTPDGKCTARATGRNHGQPFCSRHLDVIRDGMRREHERKRAASGNLASVCATPEVAAVMRSQIEETMATSIDGQTWWCPKCQASLVPNVPHVCPGMTCRRCGSSVLDGKDHGVGACPGDGMP